MNIANQLKQDGNLLASAVLVVVIKILNMPDRTYNQVFDGIAGNDQVLATRINQLSAIVFKFVIHEKS